MIQALVLLFLSMLSIQWGASFAKNLFPQIGPGGLSALRILFSAIILFGLAQGWRHFGFYKKHWKGLALFGGSLGLMNLTFYYALALIPQGLAVALEFTGPLVVAVLSSRRPLDFIWAGLAALGIALSMPIEGLNTAVHPGGVLLALIAGAFWGLYIIFGKRISVHGSSLVLLSGSIMWAALVVAPWGFAVSNSGTWSATIWLQGVVIAFFGSALPYSLEMKALKNLSAQTFGILMSVEPVIASLMAFVMLDEKLTFLQQAAIACVVIASVGVTTTHSKTNRDSLAQ